MSMNGRRSSVFLDGEATKKWYVEHKKKRQKGGENKKKRMQKKVQTVRPIISTLKKNKKSC
jgi:hypothetical protein